VDHRSRTQLVVERRVADAGGTSTAPPAVFAFEGIDGAGKTALMEAVLPLLRAAGLPARVVTEFASPIGEALRASLPSFGPVARTLAFAADRAWSLDAVGDDQRACVLWDRYVDTSVALRLADAGGAWDSPSSFLRSRSATRFLRRCSPCS
jgi:thymidylate kinase